MKTLALSLAALTALSLSACRNQPVTHQLFDEYMNNSKKPVKCRKIKEDDYANIYTCIDADNKLRTFKTRLWQLDSIYGSAKPQSTLWD